MDPELKQDMRKMLENFRTITEYLAHIEQLEQRIAPDGGETVVPL